MSTEQVTNINHLDNLQTKFETGKLYTFNELDRFINQSDSEHEQVMVDDKNTFFIPCSPLSVSELLLILAKNDKSICNNYLLYFFKKNILRVAEIQIIENEISTAKYLGLIKGS